MNRKTLAFPLAFIFVLAISSCTAQKEFQDAANAQEEGDKSFKNEKYGFSFSYAPGWDEVTRDLPDKWAIIDENKNTLLFVVNAPKTSNVLELGQIRALSDFFNDEQISKLTKEEIGQVVGIVQLEKFNERSWYTYGIKSNKYLSNSLVSGTICGQYDVMVVLTGTSINESSKDAYLKILNSFAC